MKVIYCSTCGQIFIFKEGSDQYLTFNGNAHELFAIKLLSENSLLMTSIGINLIASLSDCLECERIRMN